MSEQIAVLLNEAQAYEDILNESLLGFGDLVVITKDNANVNGNPAVMLTFTVALDDGTARTAQIVTTLKLLIDMVRVLEARYQEENDQS